ncbi:MAG: hypothetical protein IKL77_02225, partial [Clostridia bacterium]|nr:hypothetical protein [Clostridia bacterium]
MRHPDSLSTRTPLGVRAWINNFKTQLKFIDTAVGFTPKTKTKKAFNKKSLKRQNLNLKIIGGKLPMEYKDKLITLQQALDLVQDGDYIVLG